MLVAKVNELNRSIALDFQIVLISVQKHIQHIYTGCTCIIFEDLRNKISEERNLIENIPLRDFVSGQITLEGSLYSTQGVLC